MKVFLFIAAAVCAYLVGGWNPAITFSKLIYKKDIRTCGSGNPGFTNFKRTFGNKWAWWVFALDLSKAAVVVAIFAHLFKVYVGDYHLGAAYTGMFAMLGHAFPAYYKFKGGKGFSVYMSTIWFIDWRAGVVAAILLVVLLLTTKYMSVATLSAVVSTVFVLLILGTDSPITIILCAAQVLFILIRHKENLKRLKNGTESKFSFKSKTKTA